MSLCEQGQCLGRVQGRVVGFPFCRSLGRVPAPLFTRRNLPLSGESKTRLSYLQVKFKMAGYGKAGRLMAVIGDQVNI